MHFLYFHYSITHTFFSSCPYYLMHVLKIIFIISLSFFEQSLHLLVIFYQNSFFNWLHFLPYYLSFISFNCCFYNYLIRFSLFTFYFPNNLLSFFLNNFPLCFCFNCIFFVRLTYYLARLPFSTFTSFLSNLFFQFVIFQFGFSNFF